MEDQKQTSFTFEIDNFSEKEALIQPPNFSSGGCEWFVEVYPKGDGVDDHLSVYLCVANRGSLLLGWKRRARYSLVLLNQSGKELWRTPEVSRLFCAEVPAWGRINAVPLKKFQDKGFLEKDKLIVKAEVKVIEVVDEGDVTGNEMLDFQGFQVPYSQVISLSRLFAEHRDIAVNFRLKNQLVKTTYLNILFGLIETLKKPPHSLSETDLSNAKSELMELTEAGFKLDWLKTKLDDVSLEWKKSNFDGSRVRELEEHIKNLKAELNNEKVKSAAEVSSLENMVSDLKAELDMEKVKSATSDAKVLWLEQKVLDLKTELKSCVLLD
ncbi:hypothetical protein AALP_AA2G038500 [Arabis alpina]|uniref:MATH domain-containing protein n=1 Tax=Arabis alpina TaxID=50452 RepID=A0A087HF67_ARAAL|nr:hypothetical protein AALP_AA2G038500 [Arabis alpina]